MKRHPLVAGLLLLVSQAIWAVDTDQDTLPDDWELAHGRNPNVADYTVHTRYGNDRYELCAKDDAGTRCWDYAGNVLAITPFASSSYARPALSTGQCATGSDMGDCSGNNIPQYATTSYCNRYESTTDFIACDTQCSGQRHYYQYEPTLGFDVCYSPTYSNWRTTGDPGIWICQLDLVNGFQCYAVTSAGFQTGAPLTVPMTFHIDSDGDGYARPVDLDDLNPLVTPNDNDGDGILNVVDNCPIAFNPPQSDFDGDTQGDACDNDDDNDGVADNDDALDFDPTESVDTDADGVGNNADLDDDGDGIADIGDVFPLDASESMDADSDGIGNTADPDDDNDGYSDTGGEILYTNTFTGGGGAGWNFSGWTIVNDNTYAHSPLQVARNNACSLGCPPRVLAFSYETPLQAMIRFWGISSSTSTTLAFWRDGVFVQDLVLSNSGFSWHEFPMAPGNHLFEWKTYNTMTYAYIDDIEIVTVGDAFPLDSLEAVDTDGDSTGNNADWDDDNDGVPDTVDVAPLDPGNSSEIILPQDGIYKGLRLHSQTR